MGRGESSGSSQQAMRLRGSIRRRQRPQVEGQRRYMLRRRDNSGQHQSEPGYLRVWSQGFVPDSWDQGADLVEEIAVRDGDDKLHWLAHRDVTNYRFSDGGDLRRARTLCDLLNREPLGPTVKQKTDADGMLVIERVDRDWDRSMNWSINAGIKNKVSETAVESKRFDATKPDEAAAAVAYHRQLSEQIENERLKGARDLISDLRAKGDERARALFPDKTTAARGQAADRLMEAMKQGKADELVEDLEVKAKIENQEEAQASGRRAQRAIDGLSRM